jgi:hypothetical protein
MLQGVSSVFRHMLQMFHLNISKVDKELHMLLWRRWQADSALPQEKDFGS